MPKAGTHLVTKLLGLTEGIRPANIHLGHNKYAKYLNSTPQRSPNIPIGLDSPIYVPQRIVKQYLRRIRRGRYGTIHAPYSEQLSIFFRKRDVRVLIVIRDPRDVVVSHAIYISGSPKHFLYELYRTLTPDEQIMTSIAGYKGGGNDPLLLDIHTRFSGILEWGLKFPGHIVTFEKLIGEKGGGSNSEQIAEIQAVLQFLGLQSSRKHVMNMAENLFGGTKTFHRGQIGSWKQYFKTEHIVTFKSLMGSALINTGYAINNNW